MEVGARLLLQGHLVVWSYLVDAVVAGHELQPALLLEDLHHFALELSCLAYLPDGQFAIGRFLQSPYEVVTAHPYRVVAGTKDHGNAVDARRIEYPPLCPVIIEQSGEVGHIDGTVLAYLDIEVAVVCSILICRIVAYQRQSLGVICYRTEEQQHCQCRAPADSLDDDILHSGINLFTIPYSLFTLHFPIRNPLSYIEIPFLLGEVALHPLADVFSDDRQRYQML